MAKYSINTLGKIIDYETDQNKNINEVITDLIRLPNVSNNIENRETNKFSELDRGGGLIATENLFSNADGDKNKKEINRVVNSTNKLTNSSFGFESDPNREQTFYNSYNSIFDLNLDNFSTDNVQSVQIFAQNLDFYGFPLILTDAAELALDELPVRLFSLIDMITAAAIPIATISTLQFLLQENENNGANLLPVLFGETKKLKQNEDVVLYDLGSYIKYERNEEFNLGYEVLKKTLQSFERLMNYPRFSLPPKPEGFLDKILAYLDFLIQHLIYFMNGYVFYLNPGLKTSFTLDKIDLVSLTDFVSSLITTNSSRHQYNLLIRKILRNNYYLNKSINNDAKKTENNFSNFNSQLSFLSSFFFRFIGERISVGESLLRIDTSKVINKSNFFLSRFENKPSLGIGNIVSSGITDNTNSKDYKAFFDKSKEDKKVKNLPRLSYDAVKELEQRLDSDYMPFSLQDLRTNEILKFHAFIESISDSYTANYNEMGGYGRLEKIKIYANTTRSINVSFKIVALSHEDHHEMWYMINKIVSMLYPQWSKGVVMRESTMEKIKNEVDKNFNLEDELKKMSKIAIPFSQLPSNSPMVRLRVGDLITSNYSKYTAAKLFGFEPKVWSNNVKQDTISISKTEFVNIFVASLNEAINKSQRNENQSDVPSIETKRNDYNTFIDALKKIPSEKFTPELIDENKEKKEDIIIAVGEARNPNSFNFKTKAELLTNTEQNDNNNNFKNPGIGTSPNQPATTLQTDVKITPRTKEYTIRIRFKSAENVNLFRNNVAEKDETSLLFYNIPKINQSAQFFNSIFERAKGIFYKKIIEYTKNKDVSRKNTQQKKAQQVTSEVDKKDLQQKFLEAETNDKKINNPIIKAFESNMGKGLAGFITSFNIDWEQGSFWEIKEGSRAPKIVTITLGLSPSHDIPLGLDHRGNLRSLAYTVGSSASINRGLYMQENNFNYDENQFKKREDE